MNTWQLLLTLNKVCHFCSRERIGTKATNSELKRWCKNQVVRINGVVAKWDEETPEEIKSMTLFTKSKKITLL